LRDQPAGTIRISAAEHSARTLLWPAVDRLVARYPDIRVEINVNAGLTDIVAGRYDAGVRLGERLEQDMIAVRIGPRLRMVTAAAPAYFAHHGRPATPHDLSRHRCINLRMPSGNLYSWEYEQDGRELKVKVDGQLVFNDVELLVAAAVQGMALSIWWKTGPRRFWPRARWSRCWRIGASPSTAITSIIRAVASHRPPSAFCWTRCGSRADAFGP
jgi:DNA-binding transcriptional LysR family regulator